MFLAQKCFKKNIFFETNFMKNHRFLFVTKMFQKKYIFFSLCQNCITHIFRFLNRDTPGYFFQIYESKNLLKMRLFLIKSILLNHSPLS